MAEVDKAQQIRTERSPRRLGVRSLASAWLACARLTRAWLTRAWLTRRERPDTRERGMAGAEQGDVADVRAALQALPSLLDGAQLPNGIVELVIEDGELEDDELATRMMFDVHDRRITPVERGSAVPWASIAGSSETWALALEGHHDASRLRLTGEEHLARGVLAALAARSATAEPPPA